MRNFNEALIYIFSWLVAFPSNTAQYNNLELRCAIRFLLFHKWSFTLFQLTSISCKITLKHFIHMYMRHKQSSVLHAINYLINAFWCSLVVASIYIYSVITTQQLLSTFPLDLWVHLQDTLYLEKKLLLIFLK